MGNRESIEIEVTEEEKKEYPSIFFPGTSINRYLGENRKEKMTKMTKRTIVLEDVWCDEPDEFWEKKEEIIDFLLELFESINWEIKTVHILKVLFLNLEK